MLNRAKVNRLGISKNPHLKTVATPPGLEPELRESESLVLPLHNGAIKLTH